MSSRRFMTPLVVLAVMLTSCDVDKSTQPSLSRQFITYGSIDQSNTYSNVGAFIVKDPETGFIYPFCSGTMISPTVFLTASHCTIYYQVVLAPDGFTAYVSFDNPIPWGSLTDRRTKLIAAEQVITNPAYSSRQNESGDIGVVLLPSNQTHGIASAALPRQGLLDQLLAAGTLQTSLFTAVGYGVQERITGGGVPFNLDANPVPRMFAFSSFNSLNPGYLRLSQNPATGNGGTCYGDSGGPNFLLVNGVLTLLATTVTGDNVCRSTNVVYRLDTAAARRFLSAFVVLP